MSKLDQLKEMTKVVVDTGDIDSIQKFAPIDATTNPSLILSAVQKPQYKHLIDEAVSYSKSHSNSPEHQKIVMMDKLFVNFGVEILKLIPGRVSTEVDARLSFNKEGSIKRALSIIDFYEKAGIPRERVLIKLASTWEGAQAAKALEVIGFHCNMTLLFSLPQAVICAAANATLISPFVGRILDWYKKNENVSEYAPEKDPGVISVTEIYHYFKKFQIQTQIMGASFRNSGEILELAGCDLLTISPQFLDELSKAEGTVTRKLTPSDGEKSQIQKLVLDESTFRWMLNENAMATEKLSEGIRKFAEDAKKLEDHLVKTYKL